ncbi:MAG: hypothetical protein ACXAC6_01505 [Candidatus Hodarchaeales archaeon]|jgi:hypothetical protein
MKNTASSDETEDRDLIRVTFRGVDSKLYDQVIDHTRSSGFDKMGDLINHVVQYATRGDRKQFIRRHRFKMPSDLKLEIIDNQNKLFVSRNDLISAGPDTVYAFLRIKNLHFSDDVDSETLLNHVIFIQRCSNVKMGKTIPKLIEQGLVRKKRKYQSTGAPLRDVTIRNVLKKDHQEFVAKAKKEDKTVGELLNEILANIIPNFEIRGILYSLDEPDSLVVSDLDNLTVTNHALKELGRRKVLFYNIINLKFDNDIPPELFQNKILGMYKCANTKKPANISKLIWLGRLKN